MGLVQHTYGTGATYFWNNDVDLIRTEVSEECIASIIRVI
jgi:hypothetical protein